MARLSTGQTFGETGRATSPRLMGAAEQMATPGMLAQATIGAPALQPQAAPVELFQQSGVPTVGGPPRMFAPPELPAANQDMANLAKALGNFNPVLVTFGEQYVEKLKADDKRAQLVGQQFAIDLQAKFPGQQLAELRDQLYRKAQMGDTGAAEAYAKVQALSPLQLAYANRYSNRALLQTDIHAAVGKWAEMTEIDGTPRDQIPLGDPRLQKAQASLFRIPNDPVLYAEMAPQIEGRYAEMNRQQAADHLAFKTRNADTAAQKNIASHMMAQKVDRAGAIASISAQLDIARQTLGIDGYQKQLGKVEDWIVSGVLAGSIGKDGKPNLARWSYLSSEAVNVFSGITAGPNGELLVDRLGAEGGVSAQVRLTKKLMEAYQNFNEKVDYFQKEQGEDDGENLIIKYRIGDPTLTPAERDQQLSLALMEAQGLPADRRGPAISRLNSAAETGRTFTRIQQEQAERDNMFSYGKDPATEIPRIQAMVRDGLMDTQVGRRLINNYEQLLSADIRPFLNQARKTRDLLMEQEMAAARRPGSEGGSILTEREKKRLAQRGIELDQEIEAIRRSGLANGLTPSQLGKELDLLIEMQSKRTQASTAAMAPANTQPAYKSPEAWSDALGAFGRMGPGNRASNYQLQQQVQNGILFPQNVYLQNLNNFLDKGQLSDQMKLMIKRAGYQNKPAQFFLDQWKNVYPGVPFPKEYEGRVQQLNGQKISFAEPSQPASGGTSMGLAMINPSAVTALRLSQTVRRVAETAMNVVAPPAMAGPVVAGSTSLISTIQALRGANSFRGVSLIKNKKPGDYQSDPSENFFFDFNPKVVPLAIRRARSLTPQDLNALAFTALTEAGPTQRGKLEVAANLINRSAIAGNKPIVDIAKAPGQYEGVFGYTRQQLISAAEGRRIFGRRYDQLRKLLQQGI
jgi:hypothetical protein